MVVAALVTWLITAGGGFVLLGTWLAKGGVRSPRTTRLPAPVIFGHFALAAAGLVVWIIFLIADTKALAWTALILLVPVALLGFFMLVRWIGARAATDAPPEKQFPIVVVGAHGLFAVATVVLVLISALQAG